MRTWIATLAFIGCLGATAQTALTAEQHQQQLQERIEQVNATMKKEFGLADYDADKVNFINRRNLTAISEVERLAPADKAERLAMLWKNYEHSLQGVLTPAQFEKWRTTLRTAKN